ncbi:uncharacterized protein LOC108678738 [Hyalella azteca]|uniref:Uncharacterized protein LOC108678738 n=1 Tax=Hyalella azteca TaxID=294128 RepID=A0A8B7P9P3_HYAAZ|nr:uncharacterized protein LOC108678738 [Hyalella azteca]
MANRNIFSLLVLVLVATNVTAQFNNEISEGGGGGYFSGIMQNVSEISEMDWQGMIRSLVENLMQYFVAPSTRRGSAGTARNAVTDFESDLVVNFIEQSPRLTHYAKTLHSYIVAANRFIN